MISVRKRPQFFIFLEIVSIFYKIGQWTLFSLYFVIFHFNFGLCISPFAFSFWLRLNHFHFHFNFNLFISPLTFPFSFQALHFAFRVYISTSTVRLKHFHFKFGFWIPSLAFPFRLRLNHFHSISDFDSQWRLQSAEVFHFFFPVHCTHSQSNLFIENNCITNNDFSDKSEDM